MSFLSKIFFIGLLVTTTKAFSAFANKVELKVQELSTVRVKDPIRLGFFVRFLVQGSVKDSELSQKLYNLEVFPAIEAEEIKEFDSKELAFILRQKLSIIELQQVIFNIPEKFRIRSQRNFIYLEDIRKQITHQAQTFCLDCLVVFEDLRVPNVKGNEEIFDVKLDVSGIKSAGSFIIPMAIETSKGKNQLWITGKFNTFKKVFVAKKMLKQGERVAANDIEERIVNLNFVKDGTPSLEDIGGKILNRSISLGQPIFYADLKKELLLKKGQAVKILIVTDALEVTIQGIAEEPGSLGDIIKVKNSETQKLLSGTILENSVVRVQ